MPNPKYKFFTATWYQSFTDLCNWKCSYCDFPLKKERRTVSKSSLISYIEALRDVLSIKDGYKPELEIEGGEIGLVDKELLDIWFNSELDESYQVITNGKFIERGYYDLYKDKIHYMIYHCISEFESADQEFPIYDIPNCDYTVVLDKNNYKEFPKLLDRYSNINWLPHLLMNRIVDGHEYDFLEKEDFYWLYEQTKDKPNFPDYLKQRLLILSKISNKVMMIKRLICSQKYKNPFINLAENKIYRCCVSSSGDNVELTKENLIALKLNKFIFPKTYDKMCKNCIATMVFLNSGFNEKIDKTMIQDLRHVF